MQTADSLNDLTEQPAESVSIGSILLADVVIAVGSTLVSESVAPDHASFRPPLASPAATEQFSPEENENATARKYQRTSCSTKMV